MHGKEFCLSEFDLALKRIWQEERMNREGKVANYIPEIAMADPENFGIALVCVDGRVHAVGDVEKSFTIQSISKVFALCIALELVGYAAVAARVGFEPSGDAFNSIELDPLTNKPFNPMVNAGAIAVAGLIYEALGGSSFSKVLDHFSAAAGRKLDVDESVYRSEKETGNRNRAIAYLLLSRGVLKVDPEAALDLYFRLCSISVTAIDLATMGACLANVGQQPLTKAEVFDLGSVRLALSVMLTCGMYNFAGNWACDVGIPAKSGVGGGIMGVINRQMSIATYSPLLDEKGNSVRGVASFVKLADEFGLHIFDCTNAGSAFAAACLANEKNI